MSRAPEPLADVLGDQARALGDRTLLFFEKVMPVLE
jgi:hypothetical protein